MQTKIQNKDSFILFLYEHKSYKEKYTQFQLLKYMLRIWDKQIEKKEQDFSLIIPVIFYHGSGSWNYKTDFSLYFNKAMFNKYNKYIPSFDYILYDLNPIKDDKIVGSVFFVSR